MRAVRCGLCVACWLVSVVWCLLYGICRVLCVVCCLLVDVRCVLFVLGCVLCVGCCCVVFGVWCLVCVVC